MEKFTVGQARRLANISIREMAKRMGLATNTYMRKEKGLSRFYYDEAIRFASIVGMPVDTIFFSQSVS